jgi:hypothetical protein
MLREIRVQNQESGGMMVEIWSFGMALLGSPPKEAIKMIDKDKVKAALEKRRKSRGEITQKKDVMDEDDLIERELEDGVELAVEGQSSRDWKWWRMQKRGRC